MSSMSTRSQIESVRSFNRFYTRRIGVLSRHLLDSSFSLTQARVLFELAHGPSTTAGALAETLDLDAGYLSRMLGAFEDDGLIERVQSEADGRQWEISLTTPGRRAFASLDDALLSVVGQQR